MSTTTARGSLYRQYSRSSSNASSENLPPRTLARVARELRDLHKSPPEGVTIIVDGDGGNLGEVVVSCLFVSSVMVIFLSCVSLSRLRWII
jgi:hypothetical protein